MTSTRAIGSTMMLAGTALGAGMLALPIVAGGTGFIHAEILLAIIWLLMTYTGLLVLDVCLTLQTGNNHFHSMAKSTLGLSGQIITWIILLFLLYALTAAYISGGSSLLGSIIEQNWHVHISPSINALIFTGVLGSFVVCSTRAVDIANRTLLSIKSVVIIIALALLLPKIHWQQLYAPPHHLQYIWVAAPIFLTAFGYHTIIPSLATYLNKDERTLKKVIIIGATAPFIIYTLWLLGTLGLVPLSGNHSFQQITTKGLSVPDFIHTLTLLSHSPLIETSINLFSNIAMSTSFLGVTLGLLDFLDDGFSSTRFLSHRVVVILATFAPPMIFALIYPKGFIMALGFAAICVALLEVILPALMAFRLRSHTATYRSTQHKSLLLITIAAGIALVLIEVLNKLHRLPVLS